MEKALARGDAAYGEREEDVRVLRAEVRRLRGEQAAASARARKVEETRRRCLQLHSELARERARGKRLRSELETPMNVHRWRLLEGKDPTASEMTRKMHNLQRRLLARREVRIRINLGDSLSILCWLLCRKRSVANKNSQPRRGRSAI